MTSGSFVLGLRMQVMPIIASWQPCHSPMKAPDGHDQWGQLICYLRPRCKLLEHTHCLLPPCSTREHIQAALKQRVLPLAPCLGVRCGQLGILVPMPRGLWVSLREMEA